MRVFGESNQSVGTSPYRKVVAYVGTAVVTGVALVGCFRGTEASWTPESRQAAVAFEETERLLAAQLARSEGGIEKPLPRLNGSAVITYQDGREYPVEYPAVFPAPLSEEALQRGVHPANIFMLPLGIGVLENGQAQVFLFESSEYPDDQSYAVELFDWDGQKVSMPSLMQASGDMLLYGEDKSNLLTISESA